MVVAMEKYLSRKRKLLFEIEKKESQKLKACQKLQPILDEQELSVQSAANRSKVLQVWSWGITYSPSKNLETGHCSIYLAIFDLKINTNSGLHGKENFSEETIYISESSEIRELNETINF